MKEYRKELDQPRSAATKCAHCGVDLLGRPTATDYGDGLYTHIDGFVICDPRLVQVRGSYATPEPVMALTVVTVASRAELDDSGESVSRHDVKGTFSWSELGCES